MAICRSIVEHHGGRIWAESVLRGGSTFSLVIPGALGDVLPESSYQVIPARSEQAEIESALSGASRYVSNAGATQ